MPRPFGFSTGALARGDFRRGVELQRGRCPALELSALREGELMPLLHGLGDLDLGGFTYVSVHAPSRLISLTEGALCRALAQHLAPRGWPIVVHPDLIGDFAAWAELGEQLCLENMDQRKPTGRTAAELAACFARLPAASWCFDLGHARQLDPTMALARELLAAHGPRLAQVHLSEVGPSGEHRALGDRAVDDFRALAAAIPLSVPIIIESPLGADELARELSRARDALPASLAPL